MGIYFFSKFFEINFANSKNYKFAFRKQTKKTITMKTKVITLEQFAELINAADEWKLEFSRIIEENGWIDLTGDDTNICVAGNQKLYFDESGYAVIKEIKHEITDAEYDSRTEYLSYRADGEEKWAQGEFYQKPNGKHTHSHIFDDGVEVEFEF